jgi:DNA-binding CsgD family transcriptional regulator
MNRWTIASDETRARIRELAVLVDSRQAGRAGDLASRSPPPGSEDPAQDGRTGLGPNEVEALAALWWDLVEGRRWLVDSFQKGGRRYYVACESAPGFSAPTPLSPKERRVVALLGAGQSEKSARNDLAAGTSTVSTLLTKTLAKLGMRSRTDLVLLMRAAGVSSYEAARAGLVRDDSVADVPRARGRAAFRRPRGTGPPEP